MEKRGSVNKANSCTVARQLSRRDNYHCRIIVGEKLYRVSLSRSIHPSFQYELREREREL